MMKILSSSPSRPMMPFSSSVLPCEQLGYSMKPITLAIVLLRALRRSFHYILTAQLKFLPYVLSRFMENQKQTKKKIYLQYWAPQSWWRIVSGPPAVIYKLIIGLFHAVVCRVLCQRACSRLCDAARHEWTESAMPPPQRCSPSAFFLFLFLPVTRFSTSSFFPFVSAASGACLGKTSCITSHPPTV